MKITRGQLRSLIEARIKPGIPNIPSDDAMTKVDMMARSEDLQPDADSVAGAFGYPEDQSYSADLQAYDEFGSLGHSIAEMNKLAHQFANPQGNNTFKGMMSGQNDYYLKQQAVKKAAKIIDSFNIQHAKELVRTFVREVKNVEISLGTPPRLQTPGDVIVDELGVHSTGHFPDGKHYPENIFAGPIL